MAYLRKNKLICIFILFTLLFMLLGVFFNVLIDNNTKSIISININNLYNSYLNDSYYINIFKLLFSNITYISLIIILGISIIGIIITFILYLFKVFIFSFELVSLFSVLKLNNILFIFIYMIPSFINLFIYFICSLYSIRLSIIIFNMFFRHKTYNIRLILSIYIRCFIISIIGIILSSLIEFFLIPKIILFLN